ncbi:uncharacterized protein LOC123536469 isoform X2 [Mercenaria mercenaria]|uniref:uncharacterized protein LOC123536469 isoform X2 n=1 Tax=Mercenaria mercenaria TaxID=6596 RepID=UPI00234E6B75|nr:uncharacterized protein LOC123536469 isoform X2 [Mercenaria mercenaria]
MFLLNYCGNQEFFYLFQERADTVFTSGNTLDDNWEYIPAVFGTLAGIAVLAVIIYLAVHVCFVRVCVCGDSERLVVKETGNERKNSQKNSAFQKV